MIDVETLPYRPCVGIMLLNAKGLVWMGKRVPEHDAEPEHAWQMPQGGIDPGEDPLLAAKRELYEETSIRSIELIAEAPEWFTYDFPAQVLERTRKGKYRGQAQKWYAFRFTGEEAEIDILTPPHGHEREFCDWRWEKASRLCDLVIPFKQDVYKRVVSAFADLTA